MSFQAKFEKKIGINNTEDSGVWIKSTRTLRQLIGILGMSLPLLLIIFSSNCSNQPLESISHYFYTSSGTFFTVILSLVGLFLIIYTKNFMLSSIAGICAIFVVFFPTSLLINDCCIVNITDNPLRVGFHYFSAMVFLVILAYMLVFHFTKLDNEEKLMSKTVVNYKWLYRLCGIIMFIALLIMAFRFLGRYIPDQLEGFNKFYDNNKLTFWMEVFALEAFGIAWLVKGRASIKASEYKNSQNI